MQEALPPFVVHRRRQEPDLDPLLPRSRRSTNSGRRLGAEATIMPTRCSRMVQTAGLVSA